MPIPPYDDEKRPEPSGWNPDRGHDFMNATRMLTVGVLAGLLLWIAGGCSGVDQISEPQLEDFSTLTVHYTDPGVSGDPCDDALPVLDGVAQPVEWGSAEPMFVRMTGANGSGGADFYLEVRAVWTDESRVEPSHKDRIYFLIRYADATQDIYPDQLAYLRPKAPGEICENEIDGKFCPSPVADSTPSVCDSTIINPSNWLRRNAGGQEDQVMLLLTRAANAHASTDLVATERRLFPTLGPGGVLTPTTVAGVENTDVWVWRAGRTNLSPIYQYADWTRFESAPRDLRPHWLFSTFVSPAGFCEDLWIDGSRRLAQDSGTLPYAKNWVTGTNVPSKLTECIDTKKDSNQILADLNGGVPVNLGLWLPYTTVFKCTSTLACSRIGLPQLWSNRLVPGEYDYVQGWGLTIPSGSARDVRARGAYSIGQDKGFPVRTIEIMRDLDTGNSDDLSITPDPNQPGIYRIAVGVFNNSSHVGSGSTEIRLQFEKRTPATSTVENRCQG